MSLESTTCLASPRYSAKQNLHHKTFFSSAPGAQHVALAGDFNNWISRPCAGCRTEDGVRVWEFTYGRPSGRVPGG